MSFAEKSLSVFRKPPVPHNCAQAVCHGCGHDELVEAMAECGGGRAADGICGALHGAMTIVGEEKATALLDAFIAKHGAYQCKVLKKEGKVPCDQCVRTASELVEAAL
ncbi:MAG: C-GCAxxG-C-C family protein [Akkermansia sp.]